MESFKETRINVVNGIEISSVEKDGEFFVPVKPICQAIGIDFSSQIARVKESPLIAPTMVVITTVGADNRTREMVCIPERFVYGWLASIKPGKVSPEARENVIRYQTECYEILYNHFHRKAFRDETLTQMEIQQRKVVEELNQQKKEIAGALKEAEIKLRKIQDARVDESILPQIGIANT
ncbi:MAG: hypothetical protein HDS97_06215 [Bacteroidales bacterium]|nr:hypothetical protein [Bacteroidales bacterium]